MIPKPSLPDSDTARLYEAHRAMLMQAASLAAHLRELVVLASSLEEAERSPTVRAATQRFDASRLAPYLIQPGAGSRS